jgi:hypothetical protein
VPRGGASRDVLKSLALFALIALCGCQAHQPPPVTLETTRPATVESARPREDLPTGAWWALREHFDTPQILAGFDLGVGSFDGEPAYVLSRRYQDPAVGEAMPRARPRAAGPDDGLVVVTYRDDQKSIVEVVDVATGADQVVAERTKVVWGVAIDASAHAVFVAEAAPGASSLEVVRIDLGSGDSRPVADLPVSGDPGLRVTLQLDEPRAHLLVLACEQVCRLHAIELASGERRWDRPSDYEDAIAAEPDGIVLSRSCGVPCPVQVVNPMDGAGRHVGEACDAAVALRVRGRLMVATDTDGTSCEMPDPRRLFAYTPGSRTPEFDLALPIGQRIVPRSRDTGYSLDEGWLPVTESGGLSQLLDDSSGVTLVFLPTGATWRP